MKRSSGGFRHRLALATALVLHLAPTFGDDIDTDSSTNGPPAGHSLHGEAFDEGPRQSARLIDGTGKVQIKITTEHAKTQAFFNQGLGQLHGFWYFEAERSFRQAAFFDTNCAMAYWGMALANVNNTNRAAQFIKRALNLKTNASPREVLWLEAYHKYFTGDAKDLDRRKDLVLALENIIQKYPKEIEAKTFLAFQLWENDGKGIPVTSRQSVDALTREVLAEEPLHPIHHARIHLWNNKKDERALNSAARCGQSAPAIAHMWHMPGHTYSQLKRYADASWQQEAAARTDHAYMMQARILPDQIHNFAHNNQWLCTDLLYCGRVREAIELAKNMVELPRHPKYNTLNRKQDNSSYDKNNGSSMLGRNRLIDACLAFELWPEMLQLADTFYLEPTELPEEQARRIYGLALARFATGATNEAAALVAALDGCWKQLKQERFDAAEKAEEKARKDKSDTTDAMVKAMKGFNSRLERVERQRTELNAWGLIAEGQLEEARKIVSESKELPAEQRARLWNKLGDSTNAVKAAREVVKSGTNQAPALALASFVFWEAGDRKAASNTFNDLRAISAEFDLSNHIFARLSPIADSLGLPADWRKHAVKRKDTGKRPSLDSLGPFRWQPYTAPAWTLTDAEGQERSLSDYKTRPVLLVFYLGYGCPHCIEQLDLLAPAVKDFETLGISVVAISSDSAEGLERTRQKREGGYPFMMVSDKSLKTFKAYGAYDDFELMPLHGTFLVDGHGKVRWQDISFEPFREMKFLVGESRRLLGLSRTELAGTARRAGEATSR